MFIKYISKGKLNVSEDFRKKSPTSDAVLGNIFVFTSSRLKLFRAAGQVDGEDLLNINSLGKTVDVRPTACPSKSTRKVHAVVISFALRKDE